MLEYKSNICLGKIFPTLKFMKLHGIISAAKDFLRILNDCYNKVLLQCILVSKVKKTRALFVHNLLQ